MRQGEAAFVDTGAWIALALARDLLHSQAREQGRPLGCQRQAAHVYPRRHRDLPFTFLDRNTNRNVALAWKESINKPRTLRILPCDLHDLDASWPYFRRHALHKLSAVDATTFAIMKRAGIRVAFAFDHHFAVAGFRLVA